jgi:hypothetical protein
MDKKIQIVTEWKQQLTSVDNPAGFIELLDDVDAFGADGVTSGACCGAAGTCGCGSTFTCPSGTCPAPIVPDAS